MATSGRITLVLFAIIAALVFWRYSPPSPVAADAPLGRFSAMRARVVQEKLVGDGATRWAGTPGNVRGRDAMAAEFEKLGWKVEKQSATACTFYGECTLGTNVVAVLEGKEPAVPGVLITAHHDSVAASPGASDNGFGTATILETARALSAGPRPKRTVIALLTDGEEAGLTGAEAFVDSNPLAKKIRATVNVDSRGSGGPSAMFETSRGNNWIVSLLAEHLERPVTTSLFYEVYRRMPNNTDFSITKTIAPGVNFANLKHVEHYHTSIDDLAHADNGTLQHHGDHVLGMTRAFADGEITGRPNDTGDAVWFDVLALFIVHWPESWSVILGIIALAFVARWAIKAKSFDRGLLAFPAMLVAGVAVAFGIGKLLTVLGITPTPWVAHPGASLVALETGGVAGAFLAARYLATSPRSLWAGTWLWWAIIGLVASKFAPGASYLFIVPALVAGVAGAAPLNVMCVAPAVVSAVLVLSMRSGLYDALGFAVAPLLALPAVLLATTMSPMLINAPRRLPPALGGIVIAAIFVALLLPKWTTEHPQRVNVVFRQDEQGARVFVDTSWGPSATWGKPPDAMLKAAGAGEIVASALPWSQPARYGKAPLVSAPGPTLEITSAIDDGGYHRLKGKLRSERGAPLIALRLPSDREIEVKVRGGFVYPRMFGDSKMLMFIALRDDDGLPIEIRAKGEGKLDLEVLDRSLGVPPGTKADDAVKARPREAVAFQDGDVTVFATKLSL